MIDTNTHNGGVPHQYLFPFIAVDGQKHGPLCCKIHHCGRQLIPPCPHSSIHCGIVWYSHCRIQYLRYLATLVQLLKCVCKYTWCCCIMGKGWDRVCLNIGPLHVFVHVCTCCIMHYHVCSNDPHHTNHTQATTSPTLPTHTLYFPHPQPPFHVNNQSLWYTLHTLNNQSPHTHTLCKSTVDRNTISTTCCVLLYSI